MEYKDFIEETLYYLDDATFELAKKALVGEYLSFFIIDEESISQEVLSEKICDYFEKLEIKTGKSFDKYIENYIDSIDSIVGPRIAKTPQQKKNSESPVVVPRSRIYYDKAMSIKKARNTYTRSLIDFSRMMFCLYSAIIGNNFQVIQSFNFSSSCLDPEKIVDAMKEETSSFVARIGKKNRFDTKELYSPDTCTFIIAIIVLYTIISEKVIGDYYHE